MIMTGRATESFSPIEKQEIYIIQSNLRLIDLVDEAGGAM